MEKSNINKSNDLRGLVMHSQQEKTFEKHENGEHSMHRYATNSFPCQSRFACMSHHLVGLASVIACNNVFLQLSTQLAARRPGPVVSHGCSAYLVRQRANAQAIRHSQLLAHIGCTRQPLAAVGLADVPARGYQGFTARRPSEAQQQ
jgi:hypothetical protein